MLWTHIGTPDCQRGHEWGIWKSIVQGKEAFKNFIKFKLGSEETKFRDDGWMGDSSMKVSFSNLYSISGNKNERIVSNFDVNIKKGASNFLFCRNLNDWKVEKLGKLLDLLKDHKPNYRERDS